MTSNGLTFDYFLGTSQVQDQKPTHRDEPGAMDSKTLLLFFFTVYISLSKLSVSSFISSCTSKHNYF